MPIQRIRPPVASLLMLVALTTTTACPGTDPGTDGTTTDAATTSTGPEPTTAPPLTTGLDDTTTTAGPDDTTTAGPDDTSSSSGSSSSSDSGSSDSGSTTTGDTETTTGGVELCEIMLPPPGMCGGPGEDPVGPQFGCNPITQDDCAAGEKCNPWANDGGGSWNATDCFPLDAAPVAVGGACTVEGSGTSGIDNCEIGALCWDVDAETNMGTCIELCSCSYDEPLCYTPNTACAIVNNGGVLPVCVPVCNPLDVDACADGQGCYPVGELFQCAPDASGAAGAAGDVCEYINACDSGNVCLNAASVPGCVGSGCCAPSCSIDDPAPPCPAGTECTAWYEEGLEPDACLGSVGVCIAL